MSVVYLQRVLELEGVGVAGALYTLDEDPLHGGPAVLVLLPVELFVLLREPTRISVHVRKVGDQQDGLVGSSSARLALMGKIGRLRPGTLLPWLRCKIRKHDWQPLHSLWVCSRRGCPAFTPR